MVTSTEPATDEVVICGQTIRGRKHICAFVDSREEQFEILMPFLREGFEQADYIISIMDEAHAADYRCRCEAADIDLPAHEASGKAPVLRFENTYLEQVRRRLAQKRLSSHPRLW